MLSGVVDLHVPQFSQVGNAVTVTVPHSEKESTDHTIGYIIVFGFVGTSRDIIHCEQRAHLAKQNIPTVSIEVVVDGKYDSVKAWIWCTKHGWWTHDDVFVVEKVRFADKPSIQTYPLIWLRLDGTCC